MWHRRDAMIRLGQAGLGSLTLPGLLNAETNRATTNRSTNARPGTSATAKSCILIYLWGGPPQQDMFDMKPEAPQGIRSLFDPIDTVVPGIQICDQMPMIARHTDKMSIIRSFSHGSNIHEVSVYHTLTGKRNPRLGGLRNRRNRREFPNAAAIVSRFIPPGEMPASVTIPRPIGHDGVIYSGTYAGFLGPKFDSMELKPPGEVKQRAPHSLDLPQGLNATRVQARFGLLKIMEEQDRLVQKQGTLRFGQRGRGMDRFRDQAYRLLTSSESKNAFDLKREPAAMRDRYGRNEYGEAFLLARRLIEAGVRLVSVVWVYIPPNGNVANVWDNHGGTATLGRLTGYQMLKAKYCLPPLDRAYSALMDDLSQRGMLDDTLVAMLGEFGRTPKINKKIGRDHWGACQSVVLAGGGIRGGQVYGASDKHAAYPTSNPVRPEDFLATLYHAFGLPPETIIHDRENRPNHISDGHPLLSLFG
ncbi:MAG: DUF1501 domain-containing protein [Planctomycetes bacterium]|nr:DUF1501 domain-containing protein [Planctomycetota bacterium]